MIVLYKRGNAITNAAGETTSYEYQTVMKPNNFFLYYGLEFNWETNTVTWRGDTYFLDKSYVNSGIIEIPTVDEWLSTYGNWIENIYYLSTQTDGNPSGNIDNVYRMIYRNEANQAKYIIEMEYDSRDNVVSQKSVPPDGANAVTEANQYKVIIYNEHGTTIENTYNRKAVFRLFEPPEVDDFIFGYYRDAKGKTYKTGVDITVSGNMELYVEWIPAYKVTIEGISEPWTNKSAASQPIRTPEGIPEREGYTFVHYSGTDGKTYQPNQQVFYTANHITLTAIWEAKPYTVTIHHSNPAEEDSSETYPVHYDDLYDLPQLQAEGYRFLGYDGTDATSIQITGDLNLTALWETASEEAPEEVPQP